MYKEKPKSTYIINGCLCLQFGLICLKILSWMWTKSFTLLLNCVAKVVYMSFDKFLLAVELRDLSQADKSIIRASSFPKLFLNDNIYSYVYPKKTIWHLAIWQN